MTHERKALSNDPVVRGHETSDVNVRSVFVNGLMVSVGLMVVGMLFAWAAYAVFKATSPVPNDPPRTFVAPDSTTLPPLPRLQEDPRVVLKPFLRNQDSILASYGWVNKDSGIVRIPIERAMELVVERGLSVQNK